MKKDEERLFATKRPVSFLTISTVGIGSMNVPVTLTVLASGAYNLNITVLSSNTSGDTTGFDLG